MTDITVVTTFHKPGLDLYGQRFIDSFGAQVDPQIKLLVYAEDCKPYVTSKNITVLDAKETLPKLQKFKNKWKDVPKANGIPPADIKARRPRDWHKEFKWHAIRFANKVYAVFMLVNVALTGVYGWMQIVIFIPSGVMQILQTYYPTINGLHMLAVAKDLKLGLSADFMA